jgi:hypothetical protein
METLSTSPVLPHLHDSCRLWIYQSSAPLSHEQVTSIEEEGKKFCASWTSHEKQMKADVKVLYQSILLIALDESFAGASGCGIDKSVGFVRNMSQFTGFDFFDRLRMVFPAQDLKSAQIIPSAELEHAIAEGRINLNSLAVNALAQSLGEFREHGLLPLRETWWGKR